VAASVTEQSSVNRIKGALKMKKKFWIVQLLIVLCISFVLISPATARNLKASLSRIPMLSESTEKGLLIDLLKAMDEVYTEGTITIEVYPSSRAISNIINGSHDFFMPMLRSKHVDEATLPFAYSDVALFESIFVLYTNKNSDVTAATAGNYKIETEAPLVTYYGFEAQPSVNAVQSLKKVDIGRIDGYIMAMTEIDALLKTLDLKNIKRIYFDTFEAPMVVKKGPGGKEVEKLLTELLDKVKANGTYAKIMAPMLNAEFKEW
jgi:polar amino acid transport system substrate-binding protein